MAKSWQVTFDCAEPERVAAFWCDALGYRLPDPPPEFATWADFARAHDIPEDQWGDVSAAEDPDGQGPRLFFQRVPEGKQAKNRVHLDVNAGPRGMAEDERRAAVDAEVERLVGLGATRVERRSMYGSTWVVMLDVEGNEFCVQ